MSYTGPGGEFTLLCPVLLALQETVWQCKLAAKEFRGAGFRGSGLYFNASWEFPRIRGTVFWGPYNKDPTIWVR